jgi:hypothetical protein
MRHVVLFCGGITSWAAGCRVVDTCGTANLTLAFADVRSEGEDLYRFLDQAAAQIGASLIRLADGRTPWQVFAEEDYIGMRLSARARPVDRAGFALTRKTESSVHVLRPGRQASWMRPSRTDACRSARRHPRRGHRPGRPPLDWPWALAPAGASDNLARPVTVRPACPGRTAAWSCRGVGSATAGAPVSARPGGGGMKPGRSAGPVQRIWLDRRDRGERRWGRSRAGARQPGGHPARGCRQVLGPARGIAQPPTSALGTVARLRWATHGRSSALGDRPACPHGEG